MEMITSLTFDQLVFTAVTLLVVREGMIRVLPDTVAGPGGWLVNTDN